MSSSAPGLRERKRIATRRAIQVAALGLLEDRGHLDMMTIDEIAARADISPRTFFNYFATKEQAVIGDPPLPPSDVAADEFTHGGSGDLLADLRDVMVRVWGDAEPDIELAKLRQRIVKGNPELAGLRIATLRMFEEDFAGLVAQRLEHDHAGRTSDDYARQARLVTLVSIAAMRAAWQSWQGGLPVDLGPLIDEAFTELRDLFTEPAPGSVARTPSRPRESNP